MTKSKTLKSGKTVTTMTRYQLTGAQVIVLMLGPAFLSLFFRFKDLSPEEQENVKALVTTGSPISLLVKKWHDVNPLFGVPHSTSDDKVIVEMKKVIG